jgi:glycosyltransferase involved in cell wall biosynthesis
MADGRAPPDADGYAFLSWDYFRGFRTDRPKLHLDGGISLEPESEDRDCGGSRRVVFAGGLGDHAGAEFLARAFHRIVDPKAELLICGKGKNTAIEELARLDPRIKILGMVSEEELGRVGRSAAVFVNPRPTRHAPNQINFPSKLLAYLAYGKPVISTRCAGLSPEYDDVLVFIDREEEVCLAEAMQQVLSWLSPERDQVRRRIVAFAKTHTWIAQAERFVSWVGTFARRRSYDA